MIRRPPTKLDLKSDEDMKEYDDMKNSIMGSKTEEFDLSSNSNILMESKGTHNIQITPSASHHTFNSRYTLNNTWHENSTS